MGDTLLPVTTPVSRPAAPRRATTRARANVGSRAAALLAVPALVLAAAPARADVPVGWAEVEPVDGLHALLVLAGIPLGLFLLIAVAVYLPAMIRGERLLPDHGDGDPQWIGGPRQGVAELPAGSTEDSRSGGASGSW